jgi:hypothetical protein
MRKLLACRTKVCHGNVVKVFMALCLSSDHKITASYGWLTMPMTHSFYSVFISSRLFSHLDVFSAFRSKNGNPQTFDMFQFNATLKDVFH